MTVYESLKRKEEILSVASLRAESPDMKAMWLAKSKELAKKIGEMTVEEAEKEVLLGDIRERGGTRCFCPVSPGARV